MAVCLVHCCVNGNDSLHRHCLLFAFVSQVLVFHRGIGVAEASGLFLNEKVRLAACVIEEEREFPRVGL